MSEIRDIQSDEFNQEVKQSDQPVALLYWMRSCDGCRRFKPVFQQLPDVFPDIKFLQMNVMKSVENLRLSESLDVEATPTTVFFCRGVKVGMLAGYRPLDQVKKEIQEILASINCI